MTVEEIKAEITRLSNDAKRLTGNKFHEKRHQEINDLLDQLMAAQAAQAEPVNA